MWWYSCARRAITIKIKKNPGEWFRPPETAGTDRKDAKKPSYPAVSRDIPAGNGRKVVVSRKQYSGPESHRTGTDVFPTFSSDRKLSNFRPVSAGSGGKFAGNGKIWPVLLSRPVIYCQYPFNLFLTCKVLGFFKQCIFYFIWLTTYRIINRYAT